MLEIHAGSGHYSQNAATGVVTLPAARLGVWVRWPGERITRKELTPDLGEIRLKHGGPDQYPPTQTNFRGTLGLIGKRFPEPAGLHAKPIQAEGRANLWRMAEPSGWVTTRPCGLKPL